MLGLKMPWLVCCVLLSGAGVGLSARATELTDYCSGESLRATCPGQQVVVMDTVLYGRMELGRCVKLDMGYLGCSADVTDMADSRCSGQRACEILVPSLEMNPRVTCLTELNKYMRASYSCVPVEHMGRKDCKGPVHVTVSDRTSHLASLVTNETGCGNHTSPWILEAQPGQLIQMSVIDFSWQPALADRPAAHVCPNKYGYAVDLETDSMVTVCGGGTNKSRNLLISTGHKVQLVMDRRAVRQHSFLIQYTAVGCPDLVKPADAWIERDGSSLTVGCYKSKQTWHLLCEGTRWAGVIGNCTHQLARVQQLVQETSKSKHISHEVLISLIFVTAFMICLAIITVGVFILKRNHDNVKYTKPEAYIQQISRPMNGQHINAPSYKTDSRTEAFQVHPNLARNHYGQVVDNSDLESEVTEYQLPNQNRDDNVETMFTPLQRNNSPRLSESDSLNYGQRGPVKNVSKLSDSGVISLMESGPML